MHIHTNFSDGTFTPEDVVKAAHEKGLSCIALTDHDTVGAIGRAKQEAEKLGLELIAGVELSTGIDSYEIHILGYFIDWQAEWFKQKLEQLCNVRRKRALSILEKLKAFGIILNPDELLQQTGPGSVGRLHIARMLEKKGFVYSTQQAFDKYIGNHAPCYVKRFKLTPAEAIKMITRLGGLAVLAHPYNLSNDQLIPEFIQQGLRGIEAYYPEQNKTASVHYQNLADKYGLLVTGGSDYHGLEKDKAAIGEIKLPYSLVEALKKEVEALRGQKNINTDAH